MSRYADAYPYPTRHEPKPELTREEDEFWDALVEEPLPEDNPTRPWDVIKLHRHELCGHQCASGACSGREGICLDCEFKLQDSREPHNSRGMNQRG